MSATTTSNSAAEWVSLRVADGTTMPTYVARPSGGAVKAGLIVLQEAFGVNHHIRDLTERFAREGYLAAAPALFHRTDPKFEGDYNDFGAVMPHMQAVNAEGLTADMKAAYDWLGANGATAGVCAAGYCLGGYAAFLANATLPLKGAASYYGGGIAPSERSTPNRPPLVDRAANLSGPMLLVWGGKDGHITPDLVRAVEDAVRAAGKTYVQAVFGDAGHGFFCDERDAYHAPSAKQAWPLTLAFLETCLAAG